MRVVVNGSALVLDRFQTAEMIDAAGSTATIDEGCVWITMDGDTRDIVLGKGQSFTVAKNGKTLVHAEAPTRLHIAEGPPQRGWRPLWRKFRDALEHQAIAAIERKRPLSYY